MGVISDSLTAIYICRLFSHTRMHVYNILFYIYVQVIMLVITFNLTVHRVNYVEQGGSVIKEG